MKENNLWLIMACILLLSTLADIYTAMTPIFSVIETNPIYVTFQSGLLLTTITILTTIFFIYYLKKSISLQRIFIIVLGTIYLVGGHIFGAASNIQGWQNFQKDYHYNDVSKAPPEVKKQVIIQNAKEIERFKNENAKELSAQAKTSSYFWTIGLIIGMPFIISYLAFIITLNFYNGRRPERERIIEEIAMMSNKIVAK